MLPDAGMQNIWQNNKETLNWAKSSFLMEENKTNFQNTQVFS